MQSLGRVIRCCLLIDLFKFFSDLTKPHSCVREDLIFRNLLLNDFSENYLERQTQAWLVNVLLEHQCLFLALADLVGIALRHRNLCVVLLVVIGGLVFVDLVHFKLWLRKDLARKLRPGRWLESIIISNMKERFLERLDNYQFTYITLKIHSDVLNAVSTHFLLCNLVQPPWALKETYSLTARKEFIILLEWVIVILHQSAEPNQSLLPSPYQKNTSNELVIKNFHLPCNKTGLSLTGLSFIQHLLSRLFELTPSLYVKLLIFLGNSSCSSTVTTVLDHDIYSLTVIVRIIDILLLTFLRCESLVIYQLILHLLKSRSVLGVWSNLWNVASCNSNGHFIIIWRLCFFSDDV